MRVLDARVHANAICFCCMCSRVFRVYSRKKILICTIASADIWFAHIPTTRSANSTRILPLPDCCFNECEPECVCVRMYVRLFVCCVLQKAESERVFFYIYIDSLILPIPTFAFYMYRITSFNHCTPKNLYTHNTNAFASLALAPRIQMCVRAERARECERRGNEAEEVNEKRRTHTDAHTHAHASVPKYPKSEASKRVSDEKKNFGNSALSILYARV